MPGDDPFADFVAAQGRVLADVRRELAAGRKESHWMWFVFPQLAGLGHSSTARRFALPDLDAARRYLAHPVLGLRLLECTRLLLAGSARDAHAIFGFPDDLKFRSSMTLFAAAVPEQPEFQAALDRFFAGAPDPRTLDLIHRPNLP